MKHKLIKYVNKVDSISLDCLFTVTHSYDFLFLTKGCICILSRKGLFWLIVLKVHEQVVPCSGSVAALHGRGMM